MSSRQDQEREKRLQPKRIEFAIESLWDIGIVPEEIKYAEITFEWKGEIVRYFPYSGWHSGKSIKDGRGWDNLKKQLA